MRRSLILFLFAAVLLPSAAFSLKAFPMKVSVQKDLVGQFAPLLCSLDVAGAPVRLEIVTPPAHGTLDTLTPSFHYARYKGTVTIPWFRFTPQAGYTGVDTFSYRIITSLETSNVVGVRLVVYPQEPGAMTVLIVVNDLLLPKIQAEVDQYKTDLESEGYLPRIATFPNASVNLTGSIRFLYDTLANEFNRSGKFMAGAVLLGSLPVTGTRSFAYGQWLTWYADDSPLWCMSLWIPDVMNDTTVYGLMRNYANKPGWDSLYWNFDATNAKNIWVSRVQAANRGYFGSYAPDEAACMKRYFKANHDYRKGITRLAHKAYFHCAYANSRTQHAPDKYLALFPLLHKEMFDSVSPQYYAYQQAGEILDAAYHGNAAWFHAENTASWKGTWSSDIYEEPMSVRYFMTGACTSGDYGGIVNSHLFTRNGGCLLAIGNTPYAGTGVNSLVWNGTGDKSLAMLGAGERWGRVFVRGGAIRNLGNPMHGDLSLKVNMAPHNAMPFVSTLSADRVSGTAPLTVNFTAAAGDSDGTIATYEWFPTGFNFGLTDPAAAGASPVLAHTYAKPYHYKARVEALDNYNARARKIIDIAVAPSGADTLRVDCHTPQAWHFASREIVDTFGVRWLHDQIRFPGTWGYVVRSVPLKNPNYAPYKARATESWRDIKNTVNDKPYRTYVMPADTFNPWIHYKIPIPNGRYTLVLGFADCRYAPAKPTVKASMDIEVEGALWRSAFCPFDTAGQYGACNLSKILDVTDNELEFRVMTAAASTDTAFLNCFELFPGEASTAEGIALAVGQDEEPEAKPNPFNPETRITARLASSGRLEARIVDPSGRTVRTLHDGHRDAGPVTLEWNGRDDRGCPAASGLYILNFTSAGRTFQTRLVLMK